MVTQLCRLSVLAVCLALPAYAQDSTYKIVFTSRQYKPVGRSYPETWSMTLPDGKRTKHSDGECLPQEMRTEALPPNVRLPEKSERWNYLTSVSASPDGKFLLIGSEAGPSGSHFENYWLLNRSSGTMQYAGGGNEAKWSPDSATIIWSTPRELAPLAKIRVWVSHLVSFDVRTMRRQSLTSGVSYESNFFWCTTGKTAMRELRERFAAAASVKPDDLNGVWFEIRNVMTERFLSAEKAPIT